MRKSAVLQVATNNVALPEAPMTYRRISNFEGLQEELLKISGRGVRATNRIKVALVAVYAVRACRVPDVAADFRAHFGNGAVRVRSNRSPSRPLVRATFPGHAESNVTRLAQLFDRAIGSNLRSRDVYDKIVEEGLNAFPRRKLIRPQ
jgi:hypothetical protein